MQSLNFNEGYKEFCINNDETRVIRFNPADTAIVERFHQAQKTIQSFLDELKEISVNEVGELAEEETKKEDYEKSVALYTKARQLINEQVDYIFNGSIAPIVFGNQSPLASVGGKPLFERFLECIKPVIEETITQENKASQKRVAKYQKYYK